LAVPDVVFLLALKAAPLALLVYLPSVGEKRGGEEAVNVVRAASPMLAWVYSGAGQKV